MESLREMPKFVKITVEEFSLPDGQEGEGIRYMPGSLADAMAALFGEKPEKPRRKRRTKKEIAAAAEPTTGTEEPPAGESVEKPRKTRRIMPE